MLFNCCRVLKLTLLIALGFAISGCDAGDPRGRITGKVTFQGHAVSEGCVQFHNNDKGIHMTVKLKPDGSYIMTTGKWGGVKVGTYRICVRPPIPRLPPTGSKVVPKAKEYPNIPERYRDEKTSGLTLTVKEGENSFDIAM